MPETPPESGACEGRRRDGARTVGSLSLCIFIYIYSGNQVLLSGNERLHGLFCPGRSLARYPRQLDHPADAHIEPGAGLSPISDAGRFDPGQPGSARTKRRRASRLQKAVSAVQCGRRCVPRASPRASRATVDRRVAGRLATLSA
jgi:hypothetical protein